jgi:hypothetical protein
MKRVFEWLSVVMLIVLSSFVFAASSEISADFSINTPREGVVNYVRSGSSLGDYLGYGILIVVALAVVYFIVKAKRPPKGKRVSRKKVSSKKVRRKK